MRTEYFLFVQHTTSILAKLSTWCFEHSGDVSCSLPVNPSHTDEFWEGWNTCMWIYIHNIYIMYIYIDIDIYIYIYSSLCCTWSNNGQFRSKETFLLLIYSNKFLVVFFWKPYKNDKNQTNNWFLKKYLPHSLFSESRLISW